MGYSSNKKFSPLTDNIGLVIDGCGRTYEDKYYVNGAYIDLCGLSVEDYMKNPCCGGGSSTGGGTTEPSKELNEIVVKVIETETGEIYYQAFANYTVTSDITVSVKTSNNTTTELKIMVGESQSAPIVGASTAIVGVSLDVIEDDSYKYKPVTEMSSKNYVTYYATLPLNELGLLTSTKIADFDKEVVEVDNTLEIHYVIPSTDVNYNEFENESDFETFCDNNQYCFAMVLPKKVYDDKSYSIANYIGADVSDKFAYDKTYTIDSGEFVCLVDQAKTNDDKYSYIPLFGEELKYIYKLTLSK